MKITVLYYFSFFFNAMLFPFSHSIPKSIISLCGEGNTTVNFYKYRADCNCTMKVPATLNLMERTDRVSGFGASVKHMGNFLP